MNIDNIIFISFIIVNLIVGLSTSNKVNSIRDYALGNNNFSNFALISTIVATWVSGSGLFITFSKTYSNGLYYLIASSGISLQLLLMAYFLIPKMKNFLGKVSVAEIMGELYGKEVRIIIAIVGSIGSFGMIAVQFKVFGNIFIYFYGVENQTAIIMASIIVTIYSALGGIRAVTFTDQFQFLTFTLAIAIITYLIWQNTGGINLEKLLLNDKFNYKKIFELRNPHFWEMIPLLLYFSIPSMGPTFIQRISIGKDIKQVKVVFLSAAVILILIKLLIACVPLMIFSVNPDLDPNNLLSYIIDTYTIKGFKGLLIVAVVAMAMSTADSYINSSAVMFANDFCLPLNIFRNKTLLISKIFAFLLGIVSLILALNTTDMLNMILTANSFYMPLATPPILITILGFRTTKIPILYGMFTGFITTILWYILKIKIDGIVIAMMVNGLTLFLSHYILQKIHKIRNYNKNLLT